MSGTPRDNSFIGKSLQQLTTSIQGLIRSEFRLATLEVKENVVSMGIGGGLVAVGALMGVYAFGLLLISIVKMLEAFLPDWLAALLMSVVVAGIGSALVMAGRGRIKDASLAPTETFASLKDDVEVAVDRVR